MKGDKSDDGHLCEEDAICVECEHATLLTRRSFLFAGGFTHSGCVCRRALLLLEGLGGNQTKTDENGPELLLVRSLRRHAHLTRRRGRGWGWGARPGGGGAVDDLYLGLKANLGEEVPQLSQRAGGGESLRTFGYFAPARRLPRLSLRSLRSRTRLRLLRSEGRGGMGRGRLGRVCEGYA